MMKKLLCMAALCISAVSFGQNANIGILGGSTIADWGDDLNMTTTDGVIYTYQNLVVDVPPTGGDPSPGIKFRQDDDWPVNWGGNGFPTGTAISGGPNIPAVNGTYNVTFNLNTLQYSFVATGFGTLSMVGDGVNVTFATVDGITYVANNVSLPGGNVSFFMDNVIITDSEENVDGNSYNITYNTQTGEATFDFVIISMIGDGVVNWDTDVDMDTEDGVNYTLSNFTFAGGGGKFRLNHEYAPGWGGTDFPSGTGSTDGGAPNIPIVAGMYDVTFNRESGEYNFVTVFVGLEDFAMTALIVHPNPAQGEWNFNAASVIDGITIYDVTGKVVFSSTFNNANVTVNANDFATGMYYATITSAASQKTVKLAKK